LLQRLQITNTCGYGPLRSQGRRKKAPVETGAPFVEPL